MPFYSRMKASKLPNLIPMFGSRIPPSDEPARLAALQRYEVLDTRPETGFDQITHLLKTLLKVPITAISLIDDNRQWFKSKQGLSVCETRRDISFCTHTIQQSTPTIVPDARSDLRFKSSPLVTGDPHIRSYAGVPLITPDGYRVGSLCAIDTKPRDFSVEEIDLLCQLAGIVIQQLELRRIAAVDALTGAMTRSAFSVEAQSAISIWNRHRIESALIVFDLDHFKRVNDKHGHGMGDEVLKTVSANLAASLRPTDSFGRLGGEEFAVLLIGADLHEAVAAAERIRTLIEQTSFASNSQLRITASFGIAALADGFETYVDWIKAADLGLYSSKRNGRNRCSVSSHLASSRAS